MTDILDLLYVRLADEHPVCVRFFDELGIAPPAAHETPRHLFASLDEFELSDCGMSAAALEESLLSYVRRMESLSAAAGPPVSELRIRGGVDKDGRAESLDLVMRAGEVACIVGPTGSGKSRLLEDIEYLAQGDTPTKRRVLVDGTVPDDAVRHAVESKIVAQLSQSMVFVMDLPARSFLRLHAESRMMPEGRIDETVERAISCANDLAGEPFEPDASLTVLSGGQSRALMIADLAFISTSPIVLIDEIENAGVDRKRALDLLIRNDKIVFVATHDPLTALMGDKRLVVGNGGVRRVIEPNEAERCNRDVLCTVDERLMELRRLVRAGERIDFDVSSFMSP
ncbi:ABC transporter [Gordonibacter sp. 28C]|uniref:ATP-binding cassette domain-containing protein n=1 Tax=Gordonibacter sp. 28C TaxID=2078569 RepID=UPI000E19DF10|nr:ATP-binding cassette domain-containing protein [Gordonibacter sp. 28C]RDB64672.1 ABC transporter [Gordonibacter sp. 28C]